jgi:hypothetical protein
VFPWLSPPGRRTKDRASPCEYHLCTYFWRFIFTLNHFCTCSTEQKQRNMYPWRRINFYLDLNDVAQFRVWNHTTLYMGPLLESVCRSKLVTARLQTVKHATSIFTAGWTRTQKISVFHEGEIIYAWEQIWKHVFNIRRFVGKGNESWTRNMLGPQTKILSAFLGCVNGNGKVADEVPIANIYKIPINSELKQGILFTLFSITIVMSIIIIQFNLILYYLCAESTATRPITDTAQCR